MSNAFIRPSHPARLFQVCLSRNRRDKAKACRQHFFTKLLLELENHDNSMK